MSKGNDGLDATFKIVGVIPLGRGIPKSTEALELKLTEWRRIRRLSVPAEILSLLRAFEVAKEQKWDIAITDIESIEATWAMPDCFSTSHGFVLSLISGERTYLVYFTDNETEEVTLDRMGAERYPPNSDTPGGWSDDVGALNALLSS
jgi:hypothetical protein